jgi:hypothetical protein
MLVPAPVQQQIVQQAPKLAYVPSRLAPGWRYVTWSSTGRLLVIVFRNRAGGEVDFLVSRFTGRDCSYGEQKSFQLAGVKTYWSHTAAQQRAWRCVGGILLTAVTSLPSSRFADVGLARLAASGHRLRR